MFCGDVVQNDAAGSYGDRSVAVVQLVRNHLRIDRQIARPKCQGILPDRLSRRPGERGGQIAAVGQVGVEQSFWTDRITPSRPSAETVCMVESSKESLRADAVRVAIA